MSVVSHCENVGHGERNGISYYSHRHTVEGYAEQELIGPADDINVNRLQVVAI